MAKKSKAFRDLMKQKQAPNKAFQTFRQNVRKSGITEKFGGIVENPQGEAKMSEVLEDFALPYLKSAKTYEQQKKMITLAAIAWNMALMPETERESAIEELLEQTAKNQEARQDTRGLLEQLIARKQEMFAEIQRTIVDFQFVDTGDGFHLSVASTVSSKSESSES